MSQIEAGGFLRFEPQGNGDDEFRAKLQKEKLEGYKRENGCWFRWGAAYGDLDPEKPEIRWVSALVLEKAIQDHKREKLLQAAMRRKKRKDLTKEEKRMPPNSDF